jgi:hypothetical protein
MSDQKGQRMKRIVLTSLVLAALLAADRAAEAQSSCKVCAEQRQACMKNYAGPACKTEYQMCLKSCKSKQ